jgi:hypothetical protein
VLRGRSGGCAPSDERKGIDREGRGLPYEPVHGCLDWPARAARRCRGQVPGDRVRQRAPESWTGSAYLGPLESFYCKVVCFDVFTQFRGVHNRRHDITPCPRMLPIGYGGCLLRSTPVRRHGVRRRGRDSPQRSSSVRGIMTHSVKKEKLIAFIFIRNNNNEWGGACGTCGDRDVGERYVWLTGGIEGTSWLSLR